MFRRRSLQVSLVKNPKDTKPEGATVEFTYVSPEMLNRYLKENVANLAKAAVAAYVIKVAVDTISEVAINLTSK